MAIYRIYYDIIDQIEEPANYYGADSRETVSVIRTIDSDYLEDTDSYALNKKIHQFVADFVEKEVDRIMKRDFGNDDGLKMRIAESIEKGTGYPSYNHRIINWVTPVVKVMPNDDRPPQFYNSNFNLHQVMKERLLKFRKDKIKADKKKDHDERKLYEELKKKFEE